MKHLAEAFFEGLVARCIEQNRKCSFYLLILTTVPSWLLYLLSVCFLLECILLGFTLD